MCGVTLNIDNLNKDVLKTYLFDKDTIGIILCAIKLGTISLPVIVVSAAYTAITDVDGWWDFWTNAGATLYDLLHPIENLVLQGTPENDVLIAERGDDVIYGEGGDDILHGDDGMDLLFGGDGDDRIWGEEGNDTLVGGKGNDRLEGGSGNDMYIYSLGDGNDIIKDNSDINIIKFEGIAPSDMTVFYPSYNNDAILTITSTGETLTIRDFRYSSSYRNFVMQFDDGTLMNLDDLRSPFLNVVATEESETVLTFYPNSVVHALGGNDTVQGSDGDDEIYGGTGDDTIYGYNGNDIIYGEAGNDRLEGGNGNDTYVYGAGCGNDIIKDNSDINIIKFEGIAPSDMTVFYPSYNNDAILTITSTGETLTIRDFRYSSSYRNFVMQFDDGTTGSIDLNTSEIVFKIVENKSEDELVQENADILSELYADDRLTSDILTEPDSTVISDISDSVTVTDESDEIADHTDIQVMILTENMSAFADEDNVFDNADVLNPTDDMSIMNQLLVGSQVQ